jgi:hypothetical protein
LFFKVDHHLHYGIFHFELPLAVDVTGIDDEIHKVIRCLLENTWDAKVRLREHTGRHGSRVIEDLLFGRQASRKRFRLLLTAESSFESLLLLSSFGLASSFIPPAMTLQKVTSQATDMSTSSLVTKTELEIAVGDVQYFLVPNEEVVPCS